MVVFRSCSELCGWSELKFQSPHIFWQFAISDLLLISLSSAIFDVAVSASEWPALKDHLDTLPQHTGVKSVAPDGFSAKSVQPGILSR